MSQKFQYQNYLVKVEYFNRDESIEIEIEDLANGKKYFSTINSENIQIQPVKRFYKILTNGLESKPNYYVKINQITHESKNKLVEKLY